jgi:hypothetical protein
MDENSFFPQAHSSKSEVLYFLHQAAWIYVPATYIFKAIEDILILLSYKAWEWGGIISNMNPPVA